jgi:hypothetical protein
VFLRERPHREILRQVFGDRDGPGIASRVLEAVEGGVGAEDDVVGVALPNPVRDVIEIERVPQLPRDDVVGARGVPAQANAADQLAACGIEAQAAAEDVDPPRSASRS